MDAKHVLGLIEAERDAALVGNHEDAQASARKSGNGFNCTGQKMKMLPILDIPAFRQLTVNHSVAVKEYSTYRRSSISAMGHAIMINNRTHFMTRPAAIERNAPSPDLDSVIGMAMAAHREVIQSVREQLRGLEVGGA